MDVAVATRLQRQTWLNLRTLLGLCLFAVALVSGWSVLGAVDTGVPVWAVARDLPEGARLTSIDVTRTEVRMPPSHLQIYLDAQTPVEGSVLLRPVREGELLSASWIARAGSAASTRSITVPVTPDHAVGGDLVPGDRVDVFATVAADTRGARTKLLVEAVEVEALATSAGLVVEGESLVGLTLSVPAQDVAKIVFAIRTAEIDVVRLEGVPGGSGRSAVELRDL